MLLNCVLDDSILHSISELLKEYAKLPQHQAELEVRIQTSDGDKVSNGVNESIFKTWKKRLDYQAPHVEQSNDVIKTKQTKYYDLRCITPAHTNAQPTFERKYKMSQFNTDFHLISEYIPRRNKRGSMEPSAFQTLPVRVALAHEKPTDSSEYVSTNSPEQTRTRMRTSYFFPKHSSKHPDYLVRLDFTETYFDRQKLYQVEIEFLQHVQDLQMFQMLFQKGLDPLLPNLHTIFSPSAYNPYSKLIVNRGIAPINIQTKHIKTGLFQYWVTNKLDGVAYTLFILTVNGKLVSLLKNDSDCWFLNSFDPANQPQLQNLFSLSGTEIRVEVAHKNKLFMFDIFTHNNLPTSQKFEQRLEVMKSLESLLQLVIGEQYQIELKLFDKGDQKEFNVCQAIEKIGAIVQQDVSHNDGIILQPDNTSQAALKWKFQDKISIDFLFVKSHQDKDKTVYVLHSCSGRDRSNEPFFVNDSQKPAILAFPDSAKWKAENNYPYNSLDGMVIECGWNATLKKFYAMKIRWDKSYPNNTQVAHDTLFDMINERTISKLIQEIRQAQNCISPSSSSSNLFQAMNGAQQEDEKTKLVRIDERIRNDLFPDAHQIQDQMITNVGLYSIAKPKHANMITKYILSFHSQAKSIVDATAGCGGNTLSFMKHFQTVIAVEKDDCTIQALNKNISLYQSLYKSKVASFHCSITEYLSKWQSVSKQYPNIDVVYMDPPWGGIGHSKQQNQRTYMLDETPMTDIVVNMLQHVPVVVLRVSKNIKLAEFQATLHLYDFHQEDFDFCWLLFVSQKGFGFKKMREENNRLKRELILKWCDGGSTQGKSVLDLGSGKGGDLFKYKDANVYRLVCVEPASKNIDELRQRLANSPRQFAKMQISLIHDKAENVDLKQEQFDVISMFYVLTFFFKSEALLDKITSMIGAHLKNGGVFIGSMMVGTPLQHLLQSGPFSGKYLNIKQNFVPDSRYGHEIEIDLKHTQTATQQNEYLIHFDLLCQKLAKHGLYLYDTSYPQFASFSEDETFISKLNMNFVFMKGIFPARLPTALATSQNFRVPSLVGANNSLFGALLDHEHQFSFHNFHAFLEQAEPYIVVAIQNQMDEWCKQLKQFLLSSLDLQTFLSSGLADHLDSAELVLKEYYNLLHKLIHPDAFIDLSIAALIPCLLHISLEVYNVDTSQIHTFMSSEEAPIVRLAFLSPNRFELILQP